MWYRINLTYRNSIVALSKNAMNALLKSIGALSAAHEFLVSHTTFVTATHVLPPPYTPVKWSADHTTTEYTGVYDPRLALALLIIDMLSFVH